MSDNVLLKLFTEISLYSTFPSKMSLVLQNNDSSTIVTKFKQNISCSLELEEKKSKK